MGLSFKTKNFSLQIGKSRDLLRDKDGHVTGCRNEILYDLASPYVASDNFLTLFEAVPEVAFPIRFLIDKIQKGKFSLKAAKDDSVIFSNDSINKFLTQPNALFSFGEFVTAHFAYKFLTGNSYIRAAVPGVMGGSMSLWKRCDDYWVLPANCTEPVANNPAPLFSFAGKGDMIRCYRLAFGGINEDIPVTNILHVKEMNINTYYDFYKGRSRLVSQINPISNLIAVYQARNIVYTKRGALGIIVSRKKDDTGSIPLKEDEKEEIRKEYNRVYGTGYNQYPVAILREDLDFIKTSMSIAEMQPFEETLQDAVAIAGAFSIPPQLVPRKDASTYDNQVTSERSVYDNIVIPEAKSFADSLTKFLQLDRDGMYLDVDFSEVDALQSGYKEKQERLTIISKKCREEFLSGIITLNDWRAQIGESMVSSPIYGKLLFEMSDEEIKKVKYIMGNKTNTDNSNGKIQGNNVQDQDERR